MSVRQTLRTPAILLEQYALLPLWKTVWSDHIEFLCFRTRNWGDALNRKLIEHVSGKPARGVDFHMKWQDQAIMLKPVRYAVIGSTLSHVDQATVVWGVGFSASDGSVAQPREVRAVRGPWSRKKLMKAGISCPEVYGDPALLYPRYYDPPQPVKYELGIVPHYVDDQRPVVNHYRQQDGVLVIDIRSGINRVIDQIKSCAAVASSSLHGIIAAHAYHKPAVWVKFSDDIHGDDFKFYDYYASMSATQVQPLWLEQPASPALLSSTAQLPDMLDLDKLTAACPFA